MRSRAFVAALCLGAATAAASDDDRAFVEIAAPRDTYYVGEPVRLRLRFGVDAEFFRTSAVPLFQRTLDLPVQVEMPWLRGLADATPATGAARRTFVLNDGAAEAAAAEDIVRGGRTFTVLEIVRTLMRDTPCDVVVPAPALRYAFATRFDESDLRGRVPLDRRDAAVSGSATTIHFLPLPAEGRPPEFSGAIGRFTVRAATDAAQVVIGQPFRLTLTIGGDGNFEAFDAPRLDGLAAFHVLGVLDDRSPSQRRITYEIEPVRPGVREVPEIRFAYFDTKTARYEFARTSPIPLVAGPQDDRPPSPVADATGDEGPGAGRIVALVVAALVAIATALIVSRRRAAARRRADADPIRTAMSALRANVVAGDPDAAFAAFLGACLGVPAAAVIAPDLAARLSSAGVPAGAAGRAASLLDGLVAARYGGGPASGDARAAVVALAAEIEAALRAGGGRPHAS